MTIRFLFDYLSPYAFLGWTRIGDIASRYGRDVLPVPVLFARLLDAHGTRGPAEVPAKRAYVYRDILRLSRVLDVPIEAPPSHPFNPLLALRVTLAVDDVKARVRLVDAIFRAAWIESRSIEQAEVVRSILAEQGFDGAALMERANGADVKAMLRQCTEDAIGAGVFGVPTMLVDGEFFWGVDSLPLLERYIGGEPPIDGERYERWNRLAPSAARRAGS